MTDKEKIRAEVERQYEILERVYSKTKGAYVAGRMDALDYVKQFINILPEEPVTNKMKYFIEGLCTAKENYQEGYIAGYKAAEKKIHTELIEAMKKYHESSVDYDIKIEI